MAGGEAGREVDHVISTRFSVTFLADQPTPDDAWLRYRLGFFVEAACASVAAQTARVDWLVFLDDRAPDWLREEMAELGEGLFEPVYVHGPFHAGVLQSAVAERFHAPTLITTRLDSDDGLGVRFAETVQRHAAGLDDRYINCLRGLQVDRSGQIYRYDYTGSPFLSYVERRTDRPPRTVLQDQRHAAYHLHAPVLEVVTEPLWLQVVHDANIANDIRGVRVDPKAMAGFDVPLGFDAHPSRLEVARQALASRLRRTALWWRHPMLFFQYAEGRVRGLRGTRMYDARPDWPWRYQTWRERARLRLRRHDAPSGMRFN